MTQRIDTIEALARAEAHAPFLRLLINRLPEIADLLRAGAIDAALAAANAAGEGVGDVGIALRRERNALALVTAIADLSGAWDLTRVTRTLSDFADSAVDRAIRAAIAERTPDAEPCGFAVIALGKHGGRELNYSSDIDPIFLYDPGTLPLKDGEEPEKGALRIGRRAIALLSELTGDGYVFRVDMRLRPSPEVTPLALPVEQAISYYESSALAWEQAAFIRSRACSGDLALGQAFLDTIQPFVWRRSLDFGQVENISRMSRQIRDHYHKGQALGPGYDLKRGRGGIRECEFYAQVHQLIHGGRNPGLRVPDTRQALAVLAEHGAIGAEVAAHLSGCYELLRTIEHRLQMVDDQQTHSLPATMEGLENVARLHGLDRAGDMLALLEPRAQRTGLIYDEMTGENGESQVPLPQDDELLLAHLQALGAEAADTLAARIAHWRSGKVRAIRSAPAREAFERVLPLLVSALIAAPDVVQATNRFDNLVERLPSAINFFNLLDARPGLLQLLGDILSYAPVLAEQLGRRAELFDRLIDTSALDLPGSIRHLAARFVRVSEGCDYEQMLDRVRGEVAEERFALGVQLIEGRQDPLDVAEAYARIAEAALNVLADATVAEFESKHGRIAGSELVIMALGRMGGGALTHASDLDLVFLFTGQPGQESDGARPLSTTLYFNRLAQRIVAAMSVPTAAGPLYEVDTRLRPSGTQGPLCVSFDSFQRYQQEEAWTWEHMALCRARPIYGSAEAQGQLQEIILDVLGRERDQDKLRADVVNMRRDIAVNKAPKGDLDAKLLPGGLVDVEFLTHYLQLAHHTAHFPPLEKAIAALAEQGYLEQDMREVHLMLTRMLIALRLVAPDCTAPSEPARALIAHCVGVRDWESLVATFDAARAKTLALWTSLLGPRDF